MSAPHLAHIRRLTIHDTVTCATTKALFFSIEKHFLQEAEIHACITGVIRFRNFPFGVFLTSRIQHYWTTLISFVLFMTWMARRGVLLFFCDRRAFYKHRSTCPRFTTWRAGRQDWGEHQHTAKNFPLSRSDVRTI